MLDLADLLAVVDDKPHFELFDHSLTQKANPSWVHSQAQTTLGGQLWGSFRRTWWILTEVHVAFDDEHVYCPDLTGWRRDRVADPPRDFPVRVRPDWICEILSPSNASRDTVHKLRGYHRAGVPHYWIVDPAARTLTVYRWQAEGYLAVLSATPPERVRAEPFDAIELSVAAMFGDEDG
jgi:Uma2 family endonuclease